MLRDAVKRRAEKWIREVVEAVDPDLARLLVVFWAPVLPEDAWAWALDEHEPIAILLSERAWAIGTPDENADTLLHEAAHLLAWRRHRPERLGRRRIRVIPVHGREWRRAFADLIRAAEEVDWDPVLDRGRGPR